MVGTRGPDRFANASERPLIEVMLTAPVAIARDPVTERDYAPFDLAHAADPGDLPVAAP